MAQAGDGQPRSSKRRAGHQLSKRVTGEELTRFTNRARAAGYANQQAYLTAFILGEIEPDLAAKRDIVMSLGHLGKIGSNLNQIAHAINAQRVTSLGPQDLELIKQAQAAVENIGAEIRKALRR